MIARSITNGIITATTSPARRERPLLLIHLCAVTGWRDRRTRVRDTRSCTQFRLSILATHSHTISSTGGFRVPAGQDSGNSCSYARTAGRSGAAPIGPCFRVELEERGDIGGGGGAMALPIKLEELMRLTAKGNNHTH